MNDDLREELASVVRETTYQAPYADRVADALLPVVRAYAAQQLRDAAAELESVAHQCGAPSVLTERAAFLESGR